MIVDVEKLDLLNHGRTIRRVVSELLHDTDQRSTPVKEEEIGRRVITGVIRDLALEGYDVAVKND